MHLALMHFVSRPRQSPKTTTSSPACLSADITDSGTLHLNSALKSSRLSLGRRILAIVRLKRTVKEVVVNTPPAVSAISSVCNLGDDSSSITSTDADVGAAAPTAGRSVYQSRVRALREKVDALRVSQTSQYAAAREAIIANDPIASRHPQQYPTDDVYSWALQQRRFRSTGWQHPKRAAGIWEDRVFQVLRDQPVPRQLVRITQDEEAAVPPAFEPRKVLSSIPHTVFCGPQWEEEMVTLEYDTRTRAETIPLPPSPVIGQEEKLAAVSTSVAICANVEDFSYLKYEYNWTRAQGGWVPPLATWTKNSLAVIPAPHTPTANDTLDDEVKYQCSVSSASGSTSLPLPTPASSCPVWTAAYENYDAALAADAPWFVETNKRPVAELPCQAQFKCLGSGASVRRRSTRRRVSPCGATVVVDEPAVQVKKTRRVAFTDDVQVVVV